MFINRGLQLLTSSQSNLRNDGVENYRIPDAARITLKYLCGQKMYNLYDIAGEKYLVIPYHYPSNDSCFLVKADESGMNFLLGDKMVYSQEEADRINEVKKEDKGKTEDKGNGTNSNGWVYFSGEELYMYDYTNKDRYKTFDYYYYINYNKNINVYYTNGYFYYNKEKIDKMCVKCTLPTITLPKEINVHQVDPKSVLKFDNYYKASEVTPEVVTSWTDAIQKKTQYIDTAIEEIKTDIEFLRSKINSFDTLCSTLRSRVQDVYLNTVKHTKQ